MEMLAKRNSYKNEITLYTNLNLIALHLPPGLQMGFSIQYVRRGTAALEPEGGSHHLFFLQGGAGNYLHRCEGSLELVGYF